MEMVQEKALSSVWLVRREALFSLTDGHLYFILEYICILIYAYIAIYDSAMTVALLRFGDCT